MISKTKNLNLKKPSILNSFIIKIGKARFISFFRLRNRSYFVFANRFFHLLGVSIFSIFSLTFILGFMGGWFYKKGNLDAFSSFRSDDRVMILAPHPDDEAIGTGGIIQEALSKKLPVKVVYVTNGDNNEAFFAEGSWKELFNINTYKYNPNEYLDLGMKRWKEAVGGMSILGLNKNDLIFLGYPDSILEKMLSQNYSKSIVAPGTRFSYSPYDFSYKKNREYKGENLEEDLFEIISQFKPTVIFTTHVRDTHKDHRAVTLFLERTLQQIKLKIRIYYYLVHFKDFPRPYGFHMNEYLYPPEKLFSQAGWISFNLNSDQEEKKEKIIRKYQSQLVLPAINKLLLSFVRKNEIFEEGNY